MEDYTTLIKEAIVVLHETRRDASVRSFDLVVAKSPIKWVSTISKFLLKEEYNICGIIVDSNIFSTKNSQISNMVVGDKLYVWFTRPLEIGSTGMKFGQEIMTLEKFRDSYEDVRVLKMKKNILDTVYIKNIQKKMDKVAMKIYGEPYDYSIPKFFGSQRLTKLVYTITGIQNTRGVSDAELIGEILHIFDLIPYNPEHLTKQDIYKNNEIMALYEDPTFL